MYYSSWGESELIAELEKRDAQSKPAQVDLVEQLLNIIDNADEMTRSDLQGAVDAFVMNNCN